MPSPSGSRPKMNSKDKRMAIDHILYGTTSRSSSIQVSIQTHRGENLKSSMVSSLEGSDSDSSAITSARRDFVISITRPATKRGYLECRLCDSEVWGPNGKRNLS